MKHFWIGFGAGAGVAFLAGWLVLQVVAWRYLPFVPK